MVLRIVAAVIAIAFGIPSFAEDNKLMLETDVGQLPPGTKVTVSMRARYTVLSMPKAKGAQPEQEYESESGDVFEWSFTVPNDGNVAKQRFEFSFKRDLDLAPQGYSALVFFPTKYTIQCPEGAKGCDSRKGTPEFGTFLRSSDGKQVRRCLTIYGGNDGAGVVVGLGDVGLGERCNDPRKTKSRRIPSTP